MLRFNRIREYENFHIFLWLVKDTCWVMIWEVAGLIMIIPTILAALHITWLRRHIRTDLFHNIAVSCWISGNSIWMIGEFFYDDGLRPPALLCFIAGLVSVLYYYLIELPRKRYSVKSHSPKITGARS
jgi:hypothetical protein